MVALTYLCKLANKDHGSISRNLYLQSFSFIENFNLHVKLFWLNSVTQLFMFHNVRKKNQWSKSHMKVYTYELTLNETRLKWKVIWKFPNIYIIEVSCTLSSM